MTVDARFKKGLELFNEGEYFECHEVIEDLWLETPSEDLYRDLYKGVIQAAAAVYQFDRGILSGAIGLFDTSIKYLEIYKPQALGLDVNHLIQEMRVCFEPLKGWDGHKIVGFNMQLAPKLRYKFSV